jgi:N-acetylglucosaminyl-diphospho-decaprenol L-rhamnosyltransferase
LHVLFPRSFPRHQLAPRDLRESCAVDQVIGAFFFVRRNLFTDLGGFDERYFMYFEEVDFSLRALRKGAYSYFLKEAKVFHFGNASSNQVRAKRLYYSSRSRLIFVNRHWPRRYARLLTLVMFVVELPARLALTVARRSPQEFFATLWAYRALATDILRGPRR